MKRTLIKAPDLSVFPTELLPFLENAPLYDSSCSPEARVIFIDKGQGFYLKKSKLGSLKTEAEMTEFFHNKGMGAKVLNYISAEDDYLLTSRVTGEDCTHKEFLSDPKRLCDTLAALLRELHESDGTGCPIKKRCDTYLKTVEENHRLHLFDGSYLISEISKLTEDEAYEYVQDGRALLKNDTLIHGDYCLPNVMLDNWQLSGFIDVGNGGMGDRHIDLFWGAWTLAFNLKTDIYRERFFDAYGRDKVDNEILKIVSAAEAFQ